MPATIIPFPHPGPVRPDPALIHRAYAMALLDAFDVARRIHAQGDAASRAVAHQLAVGIFDLARPILKEQADA